MDDDLVDDRDVAGIVAWHLLVSVDRLNVHGP